MGELYADDRVTRPDIDDKSGPSITSTEVKHAINKLKNNKATGTDLIAAEMLKALDDGPLGKLTQLFNEIYNRVLAKRTERGNIYTYPQETKSNQMSRVQDNWHNESSHETTTEIVMDRMKGKIEAELDDAQSGFRQEKGTREGLLNLRLIRERHLEVHKDVYICFLDYEKALDRVRHEPLVQCLSEIE